MRHVVLSDIGTDCLVSVKRVNSWLGLCSGTKTTGSKLRSGNTKRCADGSARRLLRGLQPHPAASPPWMRTSGCADA